MWRRLKTLWSGRSVEPPDDDELEDAGPAAGPETARAEPRDRPATDEAPPSASTARREPAEPSATSDLEEIDQAIAGGNVRHALERVRELLLARPDDAAVLRRAAKVMGRIGEDDLQRGFAAAAAGRRWQPLVELTAAFLEMADLPMALAMATAARERSGPKEPQTASALSEVLARGGDHGAVVETLEPFAPKWPTAGMVQRFGLSAVLAGKRAAWDRVAPAFDNPEVAWIGAAAERGQRFGDPDADGRALGLAVFVEYGALLLDDELPAPGDTLGPRRIGLALRRAASVLEAVSRPVERVAYASARGEVLARWLADMVGGAPIPLSARIPGQSVLAVAVDDVDVLEVAEHEAFAVAPTLLLQLVKDPATTGVPVADVIGVFGVDVRLPMDAVLADKAADRVPPPLLASELADAAGDDEDAALPALLDRVATWAAWLSVSNPPPVDERLPFLADTPDWAR